LQGGGKQPSQLHAVIFRPRQKTLGKLQSFLEKVVNFSETPKLPTISIFQPGFLLAPGPVQSLDARLRTPPSCCSMRTCLISAAVVAVSSCLAAEAAPHGDAVPRSGGVHAGMHSVKMRQPLNKGSQSTGHSTSTATTATGSSAAAYFLLTFDMLASPGWPADYKGCVWPHSFCHLPTK